MSANWKISPEVARGTPINCVTVSHSSIEFIIDCAIDRPGIAEVQCRLIVPAVLAKQIALLMSASVQSFEQMNGEIRAPGDIRGRTVFTSGEGGGN